MKQFYKLDNLIFLKNQYFSDFCFEKIYIDERSMEDFPSEVPTGPCFGPFATLYLRFRGPKTAISRLESEVTRSGSSKSAAHVTWRRSDPTKLPKTHKKGGNHNKKAV